MTDLYWVIGRRNLSAEQINLQFWHLEKLQVSMQIPSSYVTIYEPYIFKCGTNNWYLKVTLTVELWLIDAFTFCTFHNSHSHAKRSLQSKRMIHRMQSKYLSKIQHNMTEAVVDILSPQILKWSLQRWELKKLSMRWCESPTYL